jgi:hypothetical protein
MANLEKRIVAVLSDEISSKDLLALITETESAINAAAETIEAERAKSLDPVLCPNPTKARAAMERAALARDRLGTLLPRLRDRHAKASARERAAEWNADYEQVRAARDAVARKFAEVYPAVATQLVDLFQRVAQMDKEVGRINGRAPDGEHRRLAGVELTARGLQHFSRSNPSIVARLQIPDPEHSERNAWPLPAVPLAIGIVSSMAFAPGPGADWAADVEARNSARREDTARVAAYHGAQAKEQEERENANVRRAVAARRRDA